MFPNIPGSLEVWTGTNGYFSVAGSGAFYPKNNGDSSIIIKQEAISSYSEKNNNLISFSPDVYSSIYKAGVTTVQPSALRTLSLIRAY